MKKIHLVVLSFAFLTAIVGCGGDSAFPMNKRYWTPDDYHDVNSELTSLKYNQKELPNLDNPKTAAIFRKIADTANFSIVATDSQLGLKHRSQFMNDLFKEYRDLVSSYSIIDRKDKYQYPVEFVEILKFGLPMQVYYINTGNENILKDADDPKADNVVSLLRQNREILVKNYDIYLDYINYEDRFTEPALASYAGGIKDFFPALINNAAPDADYSEMLTKVENMLNKSKNQPIITQLQNIRDILKAKTNAPDKQQ